MSKESHESRLSVAALATEHGAKTIIEVGVRRGRLSTLLAKVPTLEHLYLIDMWLCPYEWMTKDFQLKNARSVKRWAKSRSDVTVLHMSSQDAVLEFKDGSIDFIYIDGDHSERGVTSDIKNYLPKVRTGGIICGDDYCLPGVGVVVDRLIHHRKVHQNGRLWWAYKH